MTPTDLRLLDLELTFGAIESSLDVDEATGKTTLLETLAFLSGPTGEICHEWGTWLTETQWTPEILIRYLIAEVRRLRKENTR
ncbi:hypothetical protein [Gordonia sp. (in: high G+C Gram-positive bacteria)]|uniref:hypothetical protein n=1 Tax=Gordonia sp. (in: high G+C Gram-positive bacteria) TaxID=84139 RepID=UPI0039E3F854